MLRRIRVWFKSAGVCCCLYSTTTMASSPYIDEYPINVLKKSYNAGFVKANETLFEALKNKRWKELQSTISYDVNHTELTDQESAVCSWTPCIYIKTDTKADLRTPLHYAAADAPPEFIQFLLDHGAIKSFRAYEGESTPDDPKSGKYAWEIAASHGRDAAIVDSLRFRLPIGDDDAGNAAKTDEAIEAMEASLAKVMNEVAGKLIEKNRLAPPQLRPIFECLNAKSKSAQSYVPVPGMYGGAKVTAFVEPLKLEVNSWIRICGGSERRFNIDQEGKIEEIHLENPM